MCMVPTVCVCVGGGGGVGHCCWLLNGSEVTNIPRVPSIDETAINYTHTILYLAASADGSNDMNIHILILNIIIVLSATKNITIMQLYSS